MMYAERKIIVALDVSSEKEALELADELAGHVGIFKIGLELIHSVGLDIVSKVAQRGPVFLDCKLHDIPNTVKKAAQAISARIRTGMFNVHATGGSRMMKAAMEGARSIDPTVRPLVLGVTLLTSLEQIDPVRVVSSPRLLSVA